MTARRDARLAPVEALLGEAMARGAFPGAVLHVRQAGQVVHHRAYGWAQVVPHRRPVTTGTLFDLASLTKPVTATAVLQLWERGALDIDRPVAAWLPAFAGAGKAAVTVRHLLTHTAGLPAWIRLYLHAASPEAAIARICATPPTAPPGTRFEYSDLGFILLGELVRLASGLPLDRYLAAHVAPVLGWRRTRFRPPPSWRRRCAATELGNAYEEEQAGEEGAAFPWRREVIVGEVHDGNAHYAFGGVAGHAGLFGPAGEVARLGQAMLDGGVLEGRRLLAPATVAEAVRDHTGPSLGSGCGLGWRTRTGTTFMGARASPRAFGHTGFTGTSIVVDPDRALVVVLLTNRVHPRVDPAIETFRGPFHDALYEALR